MARRRFEMYKIRQIIVALRSGVTIRGIAEAKLASRKKVRSVRKIAVLQKWLDVKKEVPSNDILAQFFKQESGSQSMQSSALPYKKQIE